ncbi:MAG: hypothetical protein RL154_1136 [Pseudomonadota bacterium]
MSCKCETLDDLFCCKDELALFFYEQGVMQKAKNSIHTLGYVCEIENDCLRIKLNNAQSDLDAICKNVAFAEAEMKGIMALLRNSKEPLSFRDMRSVKPLFQLATLAASSEMVEIIKNKSFTSYFQPIIDLKQGDIYGYEALLRGVKDDGSIVYPMPILEAARNGDLLFYLDRAARETALKTAAVKRIDKKLFINFLPTAIYNPENCLQDTVRWAKQLEFDPKNIVFEVVETENIQDTKHLKSILDFYKSHGYMVALDDVGSGYSSLNMLNELRPNIIKIDREIITDIHINSFKQSIFTALVKIAYDNQIIVLAEGVETQNEANYVKENGAHLAQGYYWAKPNAEPIRAFS